MLRLTGFHSFGPVAGSSVEHMILCISQPSLISEREMGDQISAQLCANVGAAEDSCLRGTPMQACAQRWYRV